MNTPSARLLVMAGKEFACVRIIGKADFNLSISFKSLVTELQAKGFKFFVLELSECPIMDSTFLGVLAGFGLKMNDMAACRGGPPIELLNPSERVIELLDTLGVLYLFQVSEGEVDPKLIASAQAHQNVSASRLDVTRACLEAHTVLMEINPKNAEKFKDVAAFLAEDLKRLSKPASE